MLTRSKTRENIRRKRRRHEINPKEVEHVNSPQNQGMSTRSKARENAFAKRRRLENDPLKLASILEKVFSFLDTASIKAARLVNELWSAEGAKMLIKKYHVKIPSDLQTAKSSSMKNETMMEFQEFLSYNSKSMVLIPNITVGAVADVKLWKSLGVLGPQVKSLKLSIMDDKAKLLSNLLKLLPNLSYLSFEGCQSILEDKNGSIMKVLTSVMSQPEKDGKLLVVSFMPLKVNSLKRLEDLEKFADCKNILIEKLQFALLSALFIIIPQLEVRTANLVSKLLQNSQKTLKKLTLFASETYLSLVKFPCMAALTEMELTFFPEDPDAFCQYGFSPCFRFSEMVPKLTKFLILRERIEQGGDDNFYGNLFKNTGSALSINTLAIVDPSPRSDFERLFQNFPKVQWFQMFRSRLTKEVFHSLCKNTKNIKLMQFNLDLDRYPGNCSELDSIFTGFSPKTVDLMRKASKSGSSHGLEDVEKLIVNPSILDLKELKGISLHVLGNGRKLPNKTLAIAGEFAFKMLSSKLRVFIDVRGCKPTSKHALPALKEVAKLSNVSIHV